MSQVIVVIGAGSIGIAIARRIDAGKHILLADLHQDKAEAAAMRFTRVRPPRRTPLTPARQHQPANTSPPDTADAAAHWI
jgi:threonine dehydrogenase-like Zn-dependent dehydrogenase